MSLVKKLYQPWFLFRPRQLFQTVARAARERVQGRAATPVEIVLPWGLRMAVDPAEAIGRCVWLTGIFDLSVTEVLYRLVQPGDVAVDVGSNIGYMASIMAIRAGPLGRVLAFEPHPLTFERLAQNVTRFRECPRTAPISQLCAACSGSDGDAELVCPPGFPSNHGLASLSLDRGQGGPRYRVRTARLDTLLGEVPKVRVVKIDVEGHEFEVLHGATEMLATRRIRTVVYENEEGPQHPANAFLRDHGYSVLQIGRTMTRLVLAPVNAPPVCPPHDPPSYLATCEPAEVLATLSRRGWQSLRHRLRVP